MNVVFTNLAKDHPGLHFVEVDADAEATAAERYDVQTVPTFLVLKDGTVADRLVGADPPALVDLVARYAISDAAPADAAKPLEDRLRELTTRAPIILMMKGSPDEPRCKFSRQIVELLRGEDITFDHFDILTDEEVRQGLKQFSNWPTYPQLYVQGKFIGGLDVVSALKEEGELHSTMNAISA